jgi:hypothetical protein
MRRMRKGGLCGLCGIERDDGAYWENYARVLDFGVPGMVPVEPDMTMPILCDNCELLITVCRAYKQDPAFAQRTYCASTERDALRLMNFRAHPELLKVLEKQRV